MDCGIIRKGGNEVIKIVLDEIQMSWVAQVSATNNEGFGMSSLITCMADRIPDEDWLRLHDAIRIYLDRKYPGAFWPVPDWEVDPEVMRAWHEVKDRAYPVTGNEPF